jgi:hypothetical protein
MNACAQDGPGGSSIMGYGPGAVLIRGRFNVRDPQKVRNMTLSLTFTGGAVVYVNGKKLSASGFQEGDIALYTPATTYEDDAYLDAKGGVLPDFHSKPPYDLYGRAKKEPDILERAEKRKRQMKGIAIPGDLLKAGVNVLAIELHRSDFSQAAKSWFAKGQTWGRWSHVCLWNISLLADPNAAVDANFQRPAGFQVWNLDRNSTVTDSDFGDPTEPLRPIILCGARNGTYSGRVVASSRTAIKGLKVVLSDLTGPSGNDTISAGQVAIRYSDDLDEAAPKEVATKADNGAVCSVWVTVKVPKTAAAGTYKGILSVAADGETAVKVPVELQVLDWTVPDPLDYKTIVGVYQSPTSVAMQYKVPMWSEEHWKLLDKSYALLGALGNKFASITVVDQGMLGEEDGEVTWKKKTDGTYEYDFTIFERHLKLIKKHLGKCPFIGLDMWQLSDNEHGGYQLNSEHVLAPGTTVTTIDLATGKKDHLLCPTWDAKDCEDFWRPVLLAAQDIFKRNDLESSLCIGFAHDGGHEPPQEVSKVFDDILGGTRWLKSGHPPDSNSTPRKVSEKGYVVYHESVYTHYASNLKAVTPCLGTPNVLFVRNSGIWDLMVWRTTPVWALFNCQAGFAHIGLDFWSIDSLEKSHVRFGGFTTPKTTYGRFVRDTGWPGPLCPAAISHPGPDGACATLEYESLREGLQEFEALLFIMNAAEKQPAKIGEDRVKRARAILQEKRADLERGSRFRNASNVPDATGWQDLSRRIFTLAGEVEKALGSK